MMKRLWPWVWELPQMVIGLILYVALFFFSRRVFIYEGTEVRQFKRIDLGSMAIGRVIYISASYTVGNNTAFYNVIEHEYGHIIQSELVGPWFLIAIGIPSILRAIWFQVFNLKHSKYEDAIFEYTATRLGLYSGIRVYARRYLQDLRDRN